MKTRKTQEEWEEEGEKLFGPDRMKWKFVCPACGNVQTVEDFRKYKDQGATPNTAYLKCIGRYDGHMDVDMGSKKPPCNYTSGGLLNINPVCVVTPEGEEIHVFEFHKENTP